MTSSSTGYRGKRAGPLPSGTFFANYPYEFLGNHRSPDVIMGELDLMLKQASPAGETAAVLIEPVLGEGGYVPAPASARPPARRCPAARLLPARAAVAGGRAVVENGRLLGCPLSRADVTTNRPLLRADVTRAHRASTS